MKDKAVMEDQKYVLVKRYKITEKLRESILERDKYTCRYCGNKKPPFHLDHVYPVSKGGETSWDNLVTSCERCNQIKHSSIMFPKPIGYFEKKEINEISIFSVVVLAFGIALVTNGMLNINEYILYGKISIYLGVFASLFSLARFSTGK